MAEDHSTYTKRFQRNYLKGTLRYHISSFWLGYLLEVKSHLEHLFRKNNDPEKKFAIFTSGRSGSTLLLDLINSSPNLQCDGELLKRRVVFPTMLLRSFAKQSSQPIYGFKLLSYQLLNVQKGIKDKRLFLDKLTNDEGYRFIHLSRNNKAKQALSIIYAFYRGQWHNQEGSKQKAAKRFELDPNIYLHFLSELQALEDFENAMMVDRTHLSLSYENDLSSPDKYENTMAQVADFLDIPVVAPQTNLKKVTPSKLSDMISNQEDLVKAVKNSPFETYASVLEKM